MCLKVVDTRRFPLTAALYYFGIYIYPAIKPSWGGGTPTPVVVYLSPDSRVLPNQQFEGDLLDESDNGFYFVRRNEKNAIFIPRASVAAMYFSDSPLPLSFLQKPGGQTHGQDSQRPNNTSH